MPVTIRPNDHPARPAFAGLERTWTPNEMLVATCMDEYTGCSALLRSSFDKTQLTHMVPSGNGFVYAALRAYHQHHNLVIRPDDVWLSILAQLNLYVNKHAEDLRHIFVSHQGRKKIEIWHEPGGDPKDAAQQFAKALGRSIKDPEMSDWVIPDFSTTTEDDRIVASITMMGTLQAYFEYHNDTICGIPSVTLEGRRSDWVKILDRVELLERLGSEAIRFREQLKPVLRRLVLSFDAPGKANVKSFWNQIAKHHTAKCCGHEDFITGWITAFTFWSAKGAPLGSTNRSGAEAVVLDDVCYRCVGISGIPAGYTSVPYMYEKQPARMLAGSVAVQACSRAGNTRTAATRADNAIGQLHTIRPVVGWWMYLVNPDAKKISDDMFCASEAPADQGFAGAVDRSMTNLRPQSTSSGVTDVASVAGTTLVGSIHSKAGKGGLREKVMVGSKWVSRLAGRVRS